MPRSFRGQDVKNSVTVIGCGSWGTTLACIVAENITKLPNFAENVNFWVFNEMDKTGFKLSDYINKNHVNIKYAPSLELPTNLVAVPDLCEAAKPSNFLIFAIPNYFVVRCCKTLLEKTRPGTQTLFLIQGLDGIPGKYLTLFHTFVQKIMKVPCSVFTGINLPIQYQSNQLSELTIGCTDSHVSDIWKTLLQNSLVNITITADKTGVELCVGLRNIIAFCAGCFDAFYHHDSFKASAIRIGIMDMIRYIDHFYPECSLKTVFLSCGIPETISLSYGSRSRRLGEIMVIKNLAIAAAEKKYLGGIVIPGPRLARRVYTQIREHKVAAKYPAFVTVCQFMKYQDREVFFDLILKTGIHVVHPDRLEPL